MQLGNKIKAARKQKNLSQEELANRLFVSRSALAKWETGQSMPDIHMLKQLAHALDVSLEYLAADDVVQPDTAAPHTEPRPLYEPPLSAKSPAPMESGTRADLRMRDDNGRGCTKKRSKLSAKSKKMFAVYLAVAIPFGASFLYYKYNSTFDALLVCMAIAIPFLGVSSFYSWLGKEHLETNYSDDFFLNRIRYILERLWMMLGIACGGAALIFLWLFLQYRSGNLNV